MSVWVAGAALVVGLAGCAGDSGGSGGDGRPDGDELSASASATGKASASGDPSDDVPAVPVPPAAMENFDEAGAKAFAEFYWEVVTYAQATGDTELLKSLELPLCDQCKSGRQWIEKVYRQGGRVKKGGYIAVANGADGYGDAGGTVLGYDVDLTVQNQSGRSVDRDGKTIRRHDEGQTRLRFGVAQDSSGTWKASDWEVFQ